MSELIDSLKERAQIFHQLGPRHGDADTLIDDLVNALEVVAFVNFLGGCRSGLRYDDSDDRDLSESQRWGLWNGSKSQAYLMNRFGRMP